MTCWRLCARMLVPLLAGLLASCSLFHRETRPCPEFSVLKDTASVTFYRDGEGRDLVDVEARAAIADVIMACAYDGNDLQVTLQVFLGAQQGPAGVAENLTLPYFVAITDKADNVLAKQVFDAELPFPERLRSSQIEEIIDQVIPLRAGQAGDQVHIYIGFQLTQAQLQENRSRGLLRWR